MSSSDIRDTHPTTGLVMGSLFLLAGLAILLVAAGRIEVDPASIHAPRWVIGVCGGMFALSGFGLLYYGFVNAFRGSRAEGSPEDDFPVVGWLLGLVISFGLAVVATWIAFGPGERAFSGSIGVGGGSAGGSGPSETFGRWVFGFGAALTWLITILSMAHGLRRLNGRRR